MHKVIFDCDNTMGIYGKDVDDGLALLYLLGCRDIDLLGITTTYGNSNIQEVYDNTKAMLKAIKREIPVLKGAAGKKERHSEASEYLVNMVNKYPGEITLLATGSLTNLLGAKEMDRGFFGKIKEVILMGGITEPLIINGKKLDELNFSCDPEASCNVLSSGANVTVMTGHLCLQAYFTETELNYLKGNKLNIYTYIDEKITPWYNFIKSEFNIEGFYNWDIVAAVYINHRELFENCICNINSNEIDLERGYLTSKGQGEKYYKINMPCKIKDLDKFNEIIFSAWASIDM